MSDPKALHDAEQVIATLRTMAGGLAVAYHELVKNSVPPEYAIKITVQMAANFRPAPTTGET